MRQGLIYVSQELGDVLSIGWGGLSKLGVGVASKWIGMKMLLSPQSN